MVVHNEFIKYKNFNTVVIKSKPSQFPVNVALMFYKYLICLQSDKRPSFRERVFAIAFTDSVHGYGLSKKTKQLFSKVSAVFNSLSKI